MTNSAIPYEDLADIDLPDLQYTHKYSNIADGPFVVERGNSISLGAMLNRAAISGLDLLVGGQMKHISEDFTLKIDTAKQEIRFVALGTGVDYLIRPITVLDQRHFYPKLRFVDLTEFKDFIQRIALNMAGGEDDLTDFALTSDDKGRVLGLFQKTHQGIYRRDGRDWVKISSDEADWADIEEHTWVSVLRGAVRLFDENSDADSISTSLFKSFIV